MFYTYHSRDIDSGFISLPISFLKKHLNKSHFANLIDRIIYGNFAIVIEACFPRLKYTQRTN